MRKEAAVDRFDQIVTNPSWHTNSLTLITSTLNANAEIVPQTLPSPSEFFPVRHSPITLTFDSMQVAIM
jgi:hypothetical protein